MKYDFDTIVDRRNTNALKWNVEEDVLPMWVADMDFKTAPCVMEAIHKKSALGIYGYSEVPEEFYQSYQTWWRKHHNFIIDITWMLFTSGVVPAISSIIRKITTPAEKVLIQAPVYNIFYNSIVNNGREIISSDLIYDQGQYHINFIDLESKLKDPQTTIMILCNPHNPIGLIWDKDTLLKIGELCWKHHVTIIADEVHCDITEPGQSYTPFASIHEHCAQISITCLSVSKAFNLAGLQSACIVVQDETLRHKVWRGLNTDEIAEPNVFACEANIVALQQGEDWLMELNSYIASNRKSLCEFIQANMPSLFVVPAQATYLSWIDCSIFKDGVDEFCAYLNKHQRLMISNGSIFGKNGKSFIRINVACPKAQLKEGLKRLKQGYEEFYDILKKEGRL